ncbi:MAG: amino acid permease [Chitinophagaceae bacterium]|nr:amino acid permease [Chitinophagaceae bacterium]
MDKQEFKPSLSLIDASMIVAGSMIGSGIFIVSADIVRQVGSAGWLIAIWLITGVLTLAAALSYGELSAMYPKAGGQYVYLKESWNKLVGFLYGWSLFTVIQTGTIAAVGVAFAKFAGYFFPIFEMSEANLITQIGIFKIYNAQLLSIGIIVFLTWVNSRGVEGGKMIQTFFTVAKLAALLGLIVLGLSMGFNADVWQANWQNAWSMKHLMEGNIYEKVTGIAALGFIAAAMVGSVFSSDAWNNITFIAGEVKNPQRNIGLSLFIGTGIVTLLYILTNIMYLGVLPLNDIANAANDRVGVAAAEKIFGTSGTYIIAALIMVSTFGCINGMILSGARVYYTMAKDKLFFSQVDQLNKKQVPSIALWIQCIWTSVLCLSGKYGDLLDYVVFAVLIFYILTMLGIFKLRVTQPDLPRSYKAFGYPFLPALYIVLATILCVALLIYKPNYTWPGLIIVLAGIPVYYLIPKSKEA